MTTSPLMYSERAWARLVERRKARAVRLEAKRLKDVAAGKVKGLTLAEAGRLGGLRRQELRRQAEEAAKNKKSPGKTI